MNFKKEKAILNQVGTLQKRTVTDTTRADVLGAKSFGGGICRSSQWEFSYY